MRWYGCKGAGHADSGLVHTVIGTAANVNDVTQANALMHGKESSVHGDAGYQGAHKRPDARQDITWHIERERWPICRP